MDTPSYLNQEACAAVGIGRVSNVCRQKVLVLDKQTLLSYASGFPAGRFVFRATALSTNLIAASCSQISVQRQQQQNNSGEARPKNNREKEIRFCSATVDIPVVPLFTA